MNYDEYELSESQKEWIKESMAFLKELEPAYVEAHNMAFEIVGNMVIEALDAKRGNDEEEDADEEKDTD